MSRVFFRALRDANAARQREWDPEQKLSRLFFSTALAGEVGEACNIAKKLERQAAGLVGSTSSVEKLAEELADAVIYADTWAMREGIDLEAAIRAKFNKTSDELGLVTRLGEGSDAA